MGMWEHSTWSACVQCLWWESWTRHEHSRVFPQDRPAAITLVGGGPGVGRQGLNWYDPGIFLTSVLVTALFCAVSVPHCWWNLWGMCPSWLHPFKCAIPVYTTSTLSLEGSSTGTRGALWVPALGWAAGYGNPVIWSSGNLGQWPYCFWCIACINIRKKKKKAASGLLRCCLSLVVSVSQPLPFTLWCGTAGGRSIY